MFRVSLYERGLTDLSDTFNQIFAECGVPTAVVSMTHKSPNVSVFFII